MLEVILELNGSLNSGVADLTNFAGVESVPSILVEIIVESSNEPCVNEVEESVAHVAAVLNKNKSTL